MAFALEILWHLSAGRPELETNEQRLDISVVFTSDESTEAALKEAAVLAKHLGGHINLVVPEAVPIRLPLTRPPVLLEWNEERLREMASRRGIDTTVHLILCRDSWETLKAILGPHSLVIVGGRHRWWPTAASRLAGKLR